MCKWLPAVLMLCAAPAWAYGPSIGLDGFYSQVHGRGGSGDGYGGRVTAKLLSDPDLFVSGQYQNNDLGADGDFRQWRSGFGMGAWTTESSFFYWQLEYVDLQAPRLDDRGGAAHLGVATNLSPRISVYGRGGYLKLKDHDGPEFVGGLAAQLDAAFGLFAEYRRLSLEGGTLGEVWAGARFTF